MADIVGADQPRGAEKDPVAALQLAAVSATMRGCSLITELKDSRGLESWHVDLWQNLLAEFARAYLELTQFYGNKNISASAWAARNLLEITIWAIYCLRSRDNAKRFYNDKPRDVFDFLDS